MTIVTIIKGLLAKVHLLNTYEWLRANRLIIKVIICRRRYARHIRNLKTLGNERKIRVLFIVSEIAKWKEQKVYEAMEQSGVFEPIVGLSAWNRQLEHRCPNEELLRIHDRAEKFFDKLGDRHVRTVLVKNGKRTFCDLSDFRELRGI